MHRSPTVQAAYEKRRAERKAQGLGCFLCEDQEVIHKSASFLHIKNDYPYDGYSKHDMLVLKKHRTKLFDPELLELNLWLAKIGSRYDAAVWNTPKNQSVEGHFHLHLLKK
jgi:hypothetical protein